MNLRSSRRSSVVATGVLVLAASGLVAAPVAGADDVRAAARSGAVAKCPAPVFGGPFSDIDGDYLTDPVVGEPGRSPSGGIVVYGSRAGDNPRFLPGSAFPRLRASASFGTAVTRFDVNRDGCDDLLVADPGHAGGAAVDLLWGSPSGIRTTNAVQLLEHGGSDDGFGTAITAVPYGTGCTPEPGDDCPKATDVYVGAPRRTVAGATDAGVIEEFEFTLDGTASYLRTVTEDDVSGSSGATAGNRFGSVLAGGVLYVDEERGYGAVLVGVPNETVNGKDEAGAVFQITNFRAELEWTQNSPGVAGGAEPGDHFGAAIGAAGDQAAVGVPGEDVGTVEDAGLVATFGTVNDAPGDVEPSGSITQNSPGVPGVAEAGDHFGAAVAVGTPNLPYCANYDFVPTREVVVGVPGEDNGGHADSGTVAVQMTAVVALPHGRCKYGYAYTALTQGRGTVLGGANEAGDQVGAAVDVTEGGFDAPPSVRALTAGIVIVGVPGEDIGSDSDAGVALAYDNRTKAVRVLGNLGGRQAGLRFGAVLPD